MYGKAMRLPSSRRTPCLRARLSGEPAMPRMWLALGAWATEHPLRARACEEPVFARAHVFLIYPAPRPVQTFYRNLYKNQMRFWLKTQDKPPAARVAAASLGTTADIGVFRTRGSG